MIELQPSQFQMIAHLLDFKNCLIETKSVVEQNTPGWVFVDSLESPVTAVICSKGNDGFYIAGNRISDTFANTVHNLIQTVLRPRLKRQNVSNFEYSALHSHNNQKLEELFQNASPTGWKQMGYHYQKAAPLPVSDLNGMQLLSIDKKFNPKIYDNNELLIRHILDHWNSLNDFYRLGYGFCVIVKGAIACLCHSGWVSGARHAVHIETVKDYRRRGYAEKAAVALTNLYVSKGQQAYWECTKSNIASAKLAEKLGYAMAYEYKCYGFALES